MFSRLSAGQKFLCKLNHALYQSINGGGESLKVIVEGSPEEIAALVLALQERQGELSETISVEFPFVDGANAYAHNLIAKNNDVSDFNRGSE